VTFKASFESNTSNSPATSKIFKMGGFSFPTTAPNNRRPSIEVTPPPPNKPTLPQRGRVLSECVPQKLISPSTPTGKSFPGFHQGYWTPPEEAADFQLPKLPPLDPSKMGPLPPELVRSPSQRLAWPPEAISSRQQQPFHYPLSDFLPPGYHHMNESTIASNMSELLDRTHLTEADGGEATGSAPQPASNWSRSYQNPVGKIYYPPTETDERWAWPSNNQTQETGGATPPTPPMPYYYGMYRQDQPMFYDPRPQPSLGIFLPKPNKTAPVALGSLLPMPYGHGVAPSDVSPNSRRSAKSQRPYSADVNQLFALNEDTRSSSGGSFKKGHRRASSYGSSVCGMQPQMQPHIQPSLNRGHSQSDIYGPNIYNPYYSQYSCKFLFINT